MRINRRFGGHSVLRRLFDPVFPRDRPFSVLDVGAASGDSARLIQSIYPAARVTNLDRHPVNLTNAPPPKIVGDAFHLPVADGSVDYVMSSLFLHHFTDREVVRLLESFWRVTRKAVLIADLERSALPYLFMALSGPILRWGEITVGDGKKSVRAAFKAGELVRLAERAGLKAIQVTTHRPAFRIALIASKTQ